MKQRSQNISLAKYALFCVCLGLYLWQKLYLFCTYSFHSSLSSVLAVPPSSLVSLAPVNQGIVMVSFSAKLWIVSPCLIFCTFCSSNNFITIVHNEFLTLKFLDICKIILIRIGVIKKAGCFQVLIEITGITIH